MVRGYRSVSVDWQAILIVGAFMGAVLARSYSRILRFSYFSTHSFVSLTLNIMVKRKSGAADRFYFILMIIVSS